MYALYYIGHSVFVVMLLTLSVMLVREVLRLSLPPLRRKRVYIILKWTVLSLFSLLCVALADRQFGSDRNFESMRALFDNREWMTDYAYEKGGIFDRSGLPERALAQSMSTRSGDFRRHYPFGEASGHLVGYSTRTRGRTGIEAVFMPVLTGVSSGRIENWPAHFVHLISSPKPRGKNVILTVDSRLQDAAQQLLQGKRGSVIALNPDNGEILAMVSSPGFSPAAAWSDSTWNSLLERENEAPFFNRSLRGLYPPGSIFKLVVAAAALENGMSPVLASGPDGFTPDGTHKPIHEHEKGEYLARGLEWTGHGRLSMKKALQKSSNVYFAMLGSMIGAQALHETAGRFGFNRSIGWNTASTSLDAGFEMKRSFFPGVNELSASALSWASIGQHKVLVSPMHVALMTAAIANGGDLMLPSLELNRFPKTAQKVISSATAGKLREMMRLVVENGTGYRANVPGLAVAGKTGTAEIGNEEPHSWFISFAPYNNPRLVIVTLVENGGYGSGVAARITGKLYNAAKKFGYF
ncbi:peptidoglycan D,D-transpeptidase FtsI family protein [candidate division KSB1 bacterium]